MTTQVLHFAALSEQDRKAVAALPDLAHGKRMELHVRSADGTDQSLAMPPAAMAAIEALLALLQRGERVAVLAEDQELTPNEAAAVLGMSRPLVVQRMEIGELAYRLVGTHRRTKLKDVLALKARMETQQAALDALAADTEELIRHHGL